MGGLESRQKRLVNHQASKKKKKKSNQWGHGGDEEQQNLTEDEVRRKEKYLNGPTNLTGTGAVVSSRTRTKDSKGTEERSCCLSTLRRFGHLFGAHGAWRTPRGRPRAQRQDCIFHPSLWEEQRRQTVRGWPWFPDYNCQPLNPDPILTVLWSVQNLKGITDRFKGGLLSLQINNNIQSLLCCYSSSVIAGNSWPVIVKAVATRLPTPILWFQVQALWSLSRCIPETRYFQ